jgi:hypothetical protein
MDLSPDSSNNGEQDLNPPRVPSTSVDVNMTTAFDGFVAWEENVSHWLFGTVTCPLVTQRPARDVTDRSRTWHCLAITAPNK